MSYGLTGHNDRYGQVKNPHARDRIWTDEEVARWIEGAGVEDAHMTTAFLLLQFTAHGRPTFSG